MVRFSCFTPHIHRPRPKKSIEGFSETDGSTKSKGLSSIIFGRNNNIASVSENSKPAGNSSNTAIERVWKSEEIKPSEALETRQVRQLKKSQSHGDELYLDGREDIRTENGTDDNGTERISSPEQTENLAAGKRVEGSPYQKASRASLSAYLGSDQALDGSIFSVGDRRYQNADKDSRQLDDTSFSGEQMDNNSNSQTPNGSPVLVRSNSMPNIADSSGSGRSSPYKYSSHHSRSSDDLRVRDKSVHESDTEVKQDQNQNQDQDEDYRSHKSGEDNNSNNKENLAEDGYGYEDGYDYSSMAKDWIVPHNDEHKLTKFLEGESSSSSNQQEAEFPGKDFKFKRIEDWVNDLQHVNLSEEAEGDDDITGYTDELPGEPVEATTTTASSSTAAKVDTVKLTPGMEAAKKYISSLSASATTAQLVNHGLVVIPFLSAFVGLRVLNLSGNAIVRITAGALPRGLHALNLSKNSIAVIEGLRELTRLRVLDLSYNRILRLGHGLASCSSLKELYLAGNKISEIEGLHRLLKLTVLDLRYNKFSTTKSLGQLAANYNSLQAISLEGNPAQKNVGDEQLRKYLLGLLPHLMYYNRQGTNKDARLGTSDRGLRSEIKNSSRKSSGGGVAGSKPRKASPSLQKRSKERSSHRLLPPKVVSSAAYENYHHQYVAAGDRLSSLRSELSMRRSRSEGTLGGPV